MSNVIGALRLADDLLARASGAIAKGQSTTAGHLVASSGRQLETVLAAPLTSGTPNGAGRLILARAVEHLRGAHASIGAGALDDALSGIRTSRFAIDLQLPYGAL